MGGYRGGGQLARSGPTLKNHKIIGFLSNTGPDPLKITKLQSQHSMACQRNAVSLGADDGPFIVALGFSIPLSTKKYHIWPPLTKLSGSAHE